MARNAEALIEEVLSMDAEGRAKVLDALVTSLEAPQGTDIGPQAYSDELKRRLDDLKSGRVQGISLDELRREWSTNRGL